MKKEVDKKEDVKKEVRQSYFCDKCGSHYVYVLADGTVVCRRCGNRNGK